MKRFSFLSNVLAAVALSVIAVIVQETMVPLLGAAAGTRMTLLAISLGYMSFLIQQLTPHFGIALIVVSWCITNALLLAINPPFYFWMLAHTAFGWLIRSALRYQQMHHWILDGVVTLLATGAGVATLLRTGNPGLSVWSHFVVLAWVAFIAAPRKNADPLPAASTFQNAMRTADGALRRLQKNSI